MELSAAWVGASVTAGSVIGGAFLNYLNGQISGVKSTQKLLFEKLDVTNKEFGEYKLHVAESYVNQAALEKALAPITESLKDLKDELKEGRKK